MSKYKKKAREIWPEASLMGDGPYAVVSSCPPEQTLELHETRDEAELAADLIDDCGCSSQCARLHEIVYLPDLGT